ncbi:MAG: hypothetical protein WBN64_11950, partial [Candidatus Deferrimicrobium sp.]
AVRAPASRSRTLGTPPSRSVNHGVRAPALPRGEGGRSFTRGGGRMSGNPGVRTDAGRSFVGRAPAMQTGRVSRGGTDGRSQRSAPAVGNRGFEQGFRSPASSGRGGGGGFRSPAGGGRGGGGGFRGSR